MNEKETYGYLGEGGAIVYGFVWSLLSLIIFL
jgi:hypothetical protein